MNTQVLFFIRIWQGSLWGDIMWQGVQALQTLFICGDGRRKRTLIGGGWSGGGSDGGGSGGFGGGDGGVAGFDKQKS